MSERVDPFTRQGLAERLRRHADDEGCLDSFIMREAADAISALTRELEEAKEARDRLAYVLGHARDAIASLGVEDLGVGNLGGLGDPYPIRDELLARIDAALLSTAPAEQVQGQGEK